MIERTFKLEGGLSYILSVPNTLTEYCALGKCDEATAIGAAVDGIVYRSCQADVRENLCDSIEAEHNITRNRKDHPKGKKDASGAVVQVIDESAGAFIKRAAAELGKDPSFFQPLVDALMQASNALPDGAPEKIAFDPSQREAKGRTLKPGKSDLADAATLLATRESKPDKWAAKVSAIAEVIGRPLALDCDQSTLALAWRDYRLEMDRRSRAGLLA